MIGRPLEFNPDIALESAMQLFWHKGYESSSLQMLLAEMGLSKSSFYQTFESKHNLFQKSIVHYQQSQIEGMKLQLEQSASAFIFLENVFLNLIDETDGPRSRRGCLLMNTASEFAQSDKTIADIVSKCILDFETIFEIAIRQAQQEGDIAADKKAHAMALYLVSSMSGLKNMIKAGASQASITVIAKTILNSLK